MKRLPFLLLATCCASLWSIHAEAICLPITCGPPPPTLWVWGDGNPPCNGTLQNCIDQAGSGDGVQIDTNGPINESISFQKCLTLQAAAGFHPLFPAGQTITATTPSTGSCSITIQGLTLHSDGMTN